MANGKLLQFPVRNPNLFSREINYQILSNSEFNQILYTAIRALPHVQDLHRREELKRALCELLLREHGVIARFTQWQGREPASVAADATYGNVEFLQWLLVRGITPYMRTRDSALRKNNPFYGPERFTYLPESNSYLCPAGEQLNCVWAQCSQSCPRPHRQRQTLWGMLTKNAMHKWTILLKARDGYRPMPKSPRAVGSQALGVQDADH
jgi:hypothetical protein